MHSSHVLKISSIGAVFLLTAFAFAFTARAAGPICSVPGDYTTIQAAVNDVGCTTINVAAGTYAEHVAVNRAVTLNGANMGIAGNGVRAAESIVDGSDTGAAFAITANDVTINGFKVQNGSGGGLFSGIWSQSGTQNLSILNNVITQNGFGIWAQCGANCLIQANLFDANNKPGPGSGGISADSTAGLTINNNEFKNEAAGNPILFQATGAGVHTGLVVSGNNFHDNAFSNIYAIGLNGASFTGNTITPASDATGISFSGADVNVTVTNNTITGGARGIRVEDAGYALGANSAITINRNNVSGNTGYGVGNTDAAITSLNAECNWWGSATGPGPVGPGSGSPVTSSVDFTQWLTTSDLVSGPCDGPIALPDVTVTIHKYVDGVHANTTNGEGQSFPMQSSWNATNIGAGSGSYSLAPSTYDAQTTNMSNGASYSTNEDTNGSSVGASCAEGKPFALVGYSTGDSEALAASSTATTTSPAFTNITTNKHVIVWNKDCTPWLTVTKIVVNDNGGTATTSDFVLFIDSATTTSGVATTTTVGAHVVSETPMSGYAATFGGDCDSSGNVTLAAGDNKTCTITNNDIALADVKVSIVKYIAGVHATAGNANSASFPMMASWDAVNIGAGSGSYALSTVGFNTPNAYEAVTANMTNGADYATNEDTSTSVVGANCASGQQFRLAGYTTGDTLALAQAGTLASTSPAFTNLTSDKWVIVWNEPCPTGPSAPPANACDLASVPGYTVVNGTSGSNTVTLAPNTMFKGKGGNDRVTAPDGNYIICLGSGNDTVVIGAGDSTIYAGGGNNSITTGNGSGYITAGSGNDRATVGNGAHTIDLGGGNNSVTTGSGDQMVTTGTGNDTITTGSGNDTINAGRGNNTVKSGAGNDSITTGSGNDTINAGADSDTCSAGGGNNSVTNCTP